MLDKENSLNVRALDNDKYVALFFAPAEKKQQLAALFNFHLQISQIPLEVSEPMVGMIKLQWWHDCLEELRQGKPPRPHPVVQGLAGSAVSLDQLDIVLNQYEKIIDNWKPRNFEELEVFIAKTEVIIFEQAANILQSSYSVNAVTAYSYTNFARKLNRNASASAKFASNPADIARKLITKSQNLLTHKDSVFSIITTHYNARMVKNPATVEAARWRMLLKLAFSRANFL